jgi:membrane protein implicated in regulation of membrane protease activity
MINDEATKGVLWLAVLGSLVGLGQLLLTKDVLTPRIIVGRAICSGALGMAAAALISIMPTLSFAAQLGLAAVLASLGTSALERILQRITGGN